MKTPALNVENDRKRFSSLTAILIAAAVTGFATFLVNKGAAWEQWTYLLHTIQGIILSYSISYYVYLHFRRTVGVRRPVISLSGILVVFITLGFIGTGLQITFYGQYEAGRSIYWAHVILSAIALISVLTHVFLHRIFLPAKRRDNTNSLFSIASDTRKKLLYQLVISLGAVSISTGTYSLLRSPYIDKAVIHPYQMTYGQDPFAPSRNETMNGGFYDVKRIGGSEQCGVCHQEIFKDWKASIHAQAASDPVYQSVTKQLASSRGIAATRYCEGCHAPVAIMSGQLTKGGKVDEAGDLHEGISCLSCHAIRKIRDTAGVASYLYDPPVPYIFAGYNNIVARKIHNYVIRLNPALHRRDMARSPLHTPELCAACHSQFMEKVTNHWGWVKMQDEYTGWLNGPFSGQSKHTFAHSDIKRCQDCHYSLVPGHDPSANTDGLQRSHRLPGANTAIPYISGDKTQVAFNTHFLQSNKVTMTIDKPKRPQALHSNKYIEPDIVDVTEPPGYYYLGDKVTINAVVSNVGVGHEFPGGTTDLNEVWVHFQVTDGQGRTVYESGAENDGIVDPKAYFYRSLPVDRDGRLVWRHDLYRMIGDSFKNVIESGGADVVTYNFTVPSWAKSPLNISAVLNYRKLNNRFTRWAMKNSKIDLPAIDVASDAITVPIRERIEATEKIQ